MSESPVLPFDFINGEVLLINKPLEWTSFDVVNKIRHSLKHCLGIKKIKVGHAGTLDPLATGLLIICTGAFTKKINTLQILDKEYTGTMVLGATTPSYDLETEINQTFEYKHIAINDLESAIKNFTGDIMQVPPVFSAIKIDGKRAYRYARDNKEVNIEPKKVTISDFEVLRFDPPEIDFRVVCSKGTYIRSLANDFGKSLKSGAYLKSLTRTKIGDYLLDDALDLENFIQILNSFKQT